MYNDNYVCMSLLFSVIRSISSAFRTINSLRKITMSPVSYGTFLTSQSLSNTNCSTAFRKTERMNGDRILLDNCPFRM